MDAANTVELKRWKYIYTYVHRFIWISNGLSILTGKSLKMGTHEMQLRDPFIQFGNGIGRLLRN